MSTAINLKQMRDCIAKHADSSKPVIIDTVHNTIVGRRGGARCWIEEYRTGIRGKKYRIWFIADRKAGPLYSADVLAILDEAIEKYGNQNATFLWAPNGDPEHYMYLTRSSDPAFQENPYQQNVFNIDGTPDFGNLSRKEALELLYRWSK